MGWPMVRRGRYKLVMNEDAKSKALFDLEADPGEQVNLRRDPAYQDQVYALLALFREELDRPGVALSATAAAEG